MSNDTKHFFSETAQAADIAEMLAKETFASTHPEHRVIRAKMVADEVERFVVCVQYGSVATPDLAFYGVSKQDRSVTVIDDDLLYRPGRD